MHLIRPINGTGFELYIIFLNLSCITFYFSTLVKSMLGILFVCLFVSRWNPGLACGDQYYNEHRSTKDQPQLGKGF